MSSSPFTLPLPLHARPMWGMRELLFRHQRHVRWNHPGPSLPPVEVMTWVLILRMMAAFALWQRNTGKEVDPDGLFLAARGMPLIWSAERAEDWERNKPWMKPNYGLHEYQTGPYLRLLDSDQPSDAYAAPAAYDSTTTPIWQAWLKHAPFDDWFDVLETSANHWEQWLMDNGWSLPSLYQEWVALGQRWGLSAHQASSWALTEMAFHAPLPAQEKCFLHILHGIDHQAPVWLSILGHAFSLTNEEALTLWGPSSLLEKQEVLGFWDRSIHARQWSPCHQWSRFQEQWSSRRWLWLRQQMWEQNSASFDRVFPGVHRQISEQETQEMSIRWTHVAHEFKDAKTALSSAAGATLLIVGAPGQGKSQLAHDLAWASGRRMVTPPVNYGDTSQKPGAQACSAMLWASQGLDHEDAAVLVLDGPASHGWEESVTDMTRLFDKFNRLPLIATTDSLSKVPPDIVRRFDKVVLLHDLPLAQRHVLAKQYFSDESLALKVARSIRTPHAIRSAAAWCHAVGSWDWATIQRHRQSLDQAMRGETTLEEPVDLGQGEPLPPWVGYAQLKDVADRLCQAFENPLAYARLGGKAPRGAILMGPPGTGKTLFARHLASRLNVPMLAPNTGPLIEKPERLRALMNQARQLAPCIVLLDEAASLVTMGGKATDTLLSEIDGADPLEGVLVIATLNGGWLLSPAIVRPGRLHEVHQVSYPEPAEREQIWAAYLSHVEVEPLDETAWPLLARSSRGFSGAEIAECVRRAGSDAVANKETQLTLKRLIQACDAVYWAAPTGQSGGHLEEQWKTAVHEAGHALLAWRHRLEVQRITVRPRANALGMVAWDRDELCHSVTRNELHGEIQLGLGGLAAEQVVFGQYSSGGVSDLDYVQGKLKRAITNFGFGHLGPVGSGSETLWSNRLRENVEEEVTFWAQFAFDEACHWLLLHRDWLEDLGRELLVERDMSGSSLTIWQKKVTSDTAPIPPAPCWRPGNRPEASMSTTWSWPASSPLEGPVPHQLHCTTSRKPSSEEGEEKSSLGG